MPGSVANASATVVFPWAFARGFRRTRAWDVRQAAYADGHREVALLTGESRKSWEFEVELAPADMAALRAFWVANPHKAMIFYDVEERGEAGLGWAYDPTGAATGAGKYEVRFDFGGELGAEIGPARCATRLRLVEVV